MAETKIRNKESLFNWAGCFNRWGYQRPVFRIADSFCNNEEKFDEGAT